MFISGQWTAAARDGHEVENPADGTTIATTPAGDGDTAAVALDAARQAQVAWARRPAVERGQAVHALADAVREHADLLARVVVAEQGKPIGQAQGEVGAAETFLRFAAEQARRIEGEILPSDAADEEIQIRRLPHGVVVGLTAWNYPLALAAMAAALLVTGLAMAQDLPPLAQKDSYKVGFAQTESNNPWRIAQTKSFVDTAATCGWDLVQTDAGGSAAKRVADVDSMIAQGIDVLFLPPREERPLIPAVMRAKAAGIPTFLVDRSVDKAVATAGKDYVTFLGSDFIDQGKRVAEWVIANHQGDGKII